MQRFTKPPTRKGSGVQIPPSPHDLVSKHVIIPRMNNPEHTLPVELLLVDPKAFIEETLNERKKAIDLIRVLDLVRSGQCAIDVPQRLKLEDELEEQSNGVTLSGGLAQISEDRIVYNHGDGFPIEANEMTAARGLLIFFQLNIPTHDLEIHKFDCFIPDGGRSKEFYDKKSPEQRKEWIEYFANRYRNIMTRMMKNTFAVLEEDPVTGRFKVDQYVEATGVIDEPVT